MRANHASKSPLGSCLIRSSSIPVVSCGRRAFGRDVAWRADRFERMAFATGAGWGTEVGCGVGVGSVTWTAGSVYSGAGAFPGMFRSVSSIAGSFSAISSSVTSGVECSTGMSASDEVLDSLEPLLARCAMSVSEDSDLIDEAGLTSASAMLMACSGDLLMKNEAFQPCSPKFEAEL